MSAGKIQNLLSAESKTLWASRSVKDQIILMDWQSTESDLNTHIPISILKNILLNWDPDVEYKNPILILDGGYGGFMDYYPTVTTKFVDRRPNQFENAMEIVNVQDIEYSTIQEVPMKNESMFLDRKPLIDRSSKAAAVKLYNTEELLHEKERLLDRSLMNEQIILDKISELDDENVQKYDGDETKLNEARLHINNERIELEDKQEELNRMKLENDHIRQQLDQEIAKNEQFRIQVDSKVNEEVEKRIAEKERRERELREKRKLLEDERREREGHELLEKKRREIEVCLI